jgi:predicted KAP-like P-loop ATPase
MVTADHAISSKEQDRLGRSPLAKRVAGMILGYKGSDSFVVGVDGPWGSGKSSFINLVLEELDGNVITVHFNPWLFTDHVSLTQSFFTVLVQTLRAAVGRKFVWTLGSLKKYGAAISGANLNLPWYLNLFLALIGMGGEDSLDSQRDKINKGLKQAGKKILIIIDDIDRLDPEEVKFVFKLVKVCANFQNTIFLLAYDRVRVSQQLSIKETGFEGGEYLKKIVQVNFLLPWE